MQALELVTAWLSVWISPTLLAPATTKSADKDLFPNQPSCGEAEYLTAGLEGTKYKLAAEQKRRNYANEETCRTRLCLGHLNDARVLLD